MRSKRNLRARARAQHLLAQMSPLPNDDELGQLRELAIDYIREAERLEKTRAGVAPEPEEMISAALDGVARDFFARAVKKATARRGN